MNRTQRAALAHETLTILQTGHYDTPTGRVDLHESLAAACAGTLLYRPHAAEQVLAELAPVPGSAQTTITVFHQTTLAAAEALSITDPSVACLNFASAKHPGGGFLSGSEAQEESLARASGLYATLQTQPAFYDYHYRNVTPLYSDHLIFSPAVPVFRNDAGALLAQPWHAAFITAAAVNAGVLRQQQRLPPAMIAPTMVQRARLVLERARQHACRSLVLGAWGCGVFQNDPAMVAQVFADLLQEPVFANHFHQLTFAVFDTTPDQRVIRPFQAIFG